MMLQRFALYVTLGAVLDMGLGCQVLDWQFWAVVALFWCAEHVTRRELIAQLNEELIEMRRNNNNKDQ